MNTAIKYGLIPILIVIIGIAAYVGFTSSQKIIGYSLDESQSEKYEECNKLLGAEKEEGCYGKLALTTQDTRACSFIETNWKKEKCLVDVATYAKNPGLYEEICPSTNARTIDRNICFQNYARDAKDASICTKVSIYDQNTGTNPRDDCYYYVAVETNDSAMCENIQTLITRDICIREIEG